MSPYFHQFALLPLPEAVLVTLGAALPVVKK